MFALLRAALLEPDPERKCAAIARLPEDAFVLRHPSNLAAVLSGAPGRPDRPELVHPRAVAARGLGTAAGRCALLHAVAHIEFNAINLALDAMLRFPGMPAHYYRDWLSVARDEARHFCMLRTRLRDYDCDYGALPAHNGLWEMAEKTAGSALHRMALVPRVLEARGLDVTPGMITKLQQAGDDVSADMLAVILEEEVAHVAIGTRWFHWLCRQQELPADETFVRLLQDYGVSVRPPLNHAARRQAGFSADELDAVQGV